MEVKGSDKVRKPRLSVRQGQCLPYGEWGVPDAPTIPRHWGVNPASLHNRGSYQGYIN